MFLVVDSLETCNVKLETSSLKPGTRNHGTRNSKLHASEGEILWPNIERLHRIHGHRDRGHLQLNSSNRLHGGPTTFMSPGATSRGTISRIGSTPNGKSPRPPDDEFEGWVSSFMFLVVDSLETCNVKLETDSSEVHA